jgi:DNA (cytosine-5)-methyltransferase 1
MRFLSVCSGIEAASVAWSPLGWKAAAFSEIEPFPCALLAHHYPDVPNHGDMDGFKDWPDATIDLLCGGTPCQSFSSAGLRAGLDDPRGQLMLTFGAIAARYRPRWLVWENVPGVLSSDGGRDFGAFLGLLGFLGYGFAYRVLDAQFVRVDGHARAVPQRRNRVFVVGCLGDWRSAAAVLLERESLRGDPAPRRSSGARVAAGLARSAESSGKGGYAGRRQEDDVNIVAGALAGNGPGAGWRLGADDAAANHCVAIQGNMLGRSESVGPAGSGISEEGISFTLTKTDVHAVAYGGNNTRGPISVSSALSAHGGSGRMDFESETFIAHTLRGEGFDASEDGTGRGTPLVVVPFDTTQITSAANRSSPKAGDLCHTLAAGAHAPAIAFDCKASGQSGFGVGSIASTQRAMGHAHSHTNGGGHQAVMTGMQVRRLTPRECERLQGFPDDYTAVPHRGKPAADGPRYKALGNSWAVNCARWVGARIELVEQISAARRAAA